MHEINHTMIRAIVLAASIAISALPAAHAEDNLLAGYDEDAMPETKAEQDTKENWRYILGIGSAYLPRYEGADKNRWVALPIVKVSYGNFFAGTTSGVGYYFIKDRDLKFGARLGSTPGRNENLDTHLTGMGDVKRAAEFALFVKGNVDHLYYLARFSGGAHGTRADIGSGYDLQLEEDNSIRVGAALSASNDRYLQTYFGVDATQAVNSGLTEFHPASSIRNVGLVAVWSHIFNRKWIGNMAVGAKKIVGDAAHSPLVVSDTYWTVNYVAIYLF